MVAVTIQAMKPCSRKIKRVLSVRLKFPGLPDFAELVTTQGFVDDKRCEASAILDPLELRHQKLLKISPIHGAPADKYVALELAMAVSLSEDGTQPFELKHKIYCQIVPDGHKPRLSRFRRAFGKTWERFPKWVRNGVRASVFLDVSFDFS